MSDLPEPLVPADVDLRDFAFMPLDVARLRDSDIAAVVSAESFRAAVILWCAAWHQVPAGSLPSDDPSLARLAGYGRDLTGWRKVNEGALRGFIECKDGRLYHPVIADKAVRAWDSKQAQRARTANATAARIAKQQAHDDARNEERHVERDASRDANRNDEPNERRDDKRNDARDVHQGIGRVKGYISSSLRSDDARAARSAFDREFWPKYPHKVGKPAALRSFEKLWREMHGIVAPILCGLERYISEKPADRPWLNPATFLNQRRFEDQPAGASAKPQSNSETRIDFGGGVTWPESSVRGQVAHWRRDPSTWPADRLGPPPGSSGCKIPDHLLREAA